MTQLVYMVILDFIESNQEQFAEFCGDESIAWANHNEFKEWLEARDKSDAKILYELKAKNERLEKEADYLAGVIASAYCAQENVTHCEKTEGLPLLKLRDACASCWREAARKAVEASHAE